MLRRAGPVPAACSAISLPMLHMITLGWFRSRWTIACKSRRATRRRAGCNRPAVFPCLPAIEGLDHHDEPHPVGQVEQLGRGRIVRGPQRVAAHLLENLELPLQCPDVERRTERAQIVMVARAIQRDPPAIELEPSRGVNSIVRKPNGWSWRPTIRPCGGALSVRGSGLAWPGPIAWDGHRAAVESFPPAGSCPDTNSRRGVWRLARDCRSIRAIHGFNRECCVLPLWFSTATETRATPFSLVIALRGHEDTPVRHVTGTCLHQPHVAIQPLAGYHREPQWAVSSRTASTFSAPK